MQRAASNYDLLRSLRDPTPALRVCTSELLGAINATCYAQPLSLAARYGARAVTTRTADQMLPPLNVYASSMTCQDLPCHHRPNENSKTRVRASQPEPIPTSSAGRRAPSQGDDEDECRQEYTAQYKASCRAKLRNEDRLPQRAVKHGQHQNACPYRQRFKCNPKNALISPVAPNAPFTCVNEAQRSSRQSEREGSAEFIFCQKLSSEPKPLHGVRPHKLYKSNKTQPCQFVFHRPHSWK